MYFVFICFCFYLGLFMFVFCMVSYLDHVLDSFRVPEIEGLPVTHKRRTDSCHSDKISKYYR